VVIYLIDNMNLACARISPLWLGAWEKASNIFPADFADKTQIKKLTAKI
jgi:hypothetical protein